MTWIRPIALAMAMALVCTAAPPSWGDEDEVRRLLERGDVRTRVRTTPEDGTLIGQKVLFEIELLTATFFRGAPKLPDLELAGAIIRRESQFGVNASVTLEGRAYASQTWAWHVYPQRDGRFAVPPLDVVLEVADESGKAVVVPTRTAALSFRVAKPPGTPTGRRVLAAPKVSVAVRWEPDAPELKVGDALRRTVTLVVEDAPAMLVPPLPTLAVDGARSYPEPARVEDKENRGTLTGTRVEEVTLVFEREGRCEIPEARVPWFDLTAQAWREEVIEGRTLTITPNPDLASAAPDAPGADEAPVPGEQPDPFPWLVGLVAIAMGIVLGRRYLPGLRAAKARRRAEQAASPAASFERFERACATNDPARVERALLQWLDRRAPVARIATVSAFVAAAGDPELAGLAEDLGRRVAQGRSTAGWSAQPLLRAVARAREASARSDRTDDRLQLNPGPDRE